MYSCHECEYKAKRASQLRRHKKSKHEGVKLEWPLRKKKFSHQKSFYLAQMNEGLEKKFCENIASKASEKFSNFRK